MVSGSSIIYNVEDKDIIAECPARSNKSKTTISDDKLFLMGGQSSKNQNEKFLSINTIYRIYTNYKNYY